MGWNTTVVVCNDAVDAIANDPDFGKKLAAAILRAHMHSDSHGHNEVSALNHANAAQVVETHHADNTVLVAVGGNYGKVVGTSLGYLKEEPEQMLNHLRNVLGKMGYNVVKKPHKG